MMAVDTTRTVYLDVIGKMHSLYKTLLLTPPSGYRFVNSASEWDNASSIATKMGFLYSMQLNILAPLFPPNLGKAYLEKFKKIPHGVDLTYSAGHLIFRKEPWVVDFEFITQLTAYKYHHFKRFKGLVEKALSDDYCKKIICWTNAGKQTVTLNMNIEKFGQKIEVVPLAVRKKNFKKAYREDGKTKLLFVGSINIPGEFEYKGGKELLEAFSILRKKHKNIELVIRSDIPLSLKEKYASVLQNVRLIEGSLPWQKLEEEFKTADVFIMPAHATPGLAFLDAMSYELPIVTTDVWANSEMVEDGVTGFVVEKSSRINYYSGNFIPAWSHYPTSKFVKTIKAQIDPNVVKRLVEKTAILIENPDLRKHFGRAGRRKVEECYSIEKRNKRLKAVLDDAISG